jgi:orotidine-5'-phosphate decarboxylase
VNETRLYIALTSDFADDAAGMLSPLTGLPLGVKVGLELFVRKGPGLVRELRRAGFPVFLDLKFHDIPFTVGGAVRSACELEPAIVNVHASGGIEMMKAAAGARSGHTRVIAVTVLTSMDGSDLELLGTCCTPLELVSRLASAARDCGLDGVVCSPLEASAVRSSTDVDFLIVTPGIRPAGSDSGDQKRIMTPAMAIRAGASALVVGRPVTGAADPAAAARSILAEIDEALATGD